MTHPRLSRKDPAAPVGIVHLGPGAFFRAFNAVYTADAMARDGGDWGICAVSLRSPDARDQLDPQGGVYTAVSLGPDGPVPRVISSVSEVLVAPEDPAAVLARMTAPATKIVSLTITEKGYCHNPATGRLRLDHPDILHDLANPAHPRSAPGFLVEALDRAGRRLSRTKIVSALEELDDFHPGLAPALSYGADRRIGSIGVHIVPVDLVEYRFTEPVRWIVPRDPD